MRRSSLVHVVAALTLAACAGRTPVAGVSPNDPADRGPIDVRLFQPHGRTVSFALNRPAYVAVFEIVPGQGVSLLYPAAYDHAATHQMEAGYNVAQLPFYNLGRTFYLASYSRATQAPTFLYAIASESPLDIAEIARKPSALRARIGFRAFAQGFSQQMMDLIDQAVVPAQPDEAWATDYLVLWPDAAPPPVTPMRILVACRDGRQIVIDARAASIPAWCRDPNLVTAPPTRQPADSASKPGSPPSDSGAAAKPQGAPVGPNPKGERPPAPKKNEGAEPGKRAPAPPTSLVVDFGTPRAVVGRAALERAREGGSWAEREAVRWDNVPARSGYRPGTPQRGDYAGRTGPGSSRPAMDSRPPERAAAAPRRDGASPPSHDPTPGGNSSRSDSPRPGATRRAQ